jgi:hypothetical protein
MAKRKDRSNVYWRARIARDHPEVAAKLASGEIRTVRAARAAAGLLRQPSLVEKMMLAWERLDQRQRNDFLRWAHASYRGKDDAPELPEAEQREEAQLSLL